MNRKSAARILVIEDEEEVRVLTQKILESSGYTVLVFGNGTQALQSAGKSGSRIDLPLIWSEKKAQKYVFLLSHPFQGRYPRFLKKLFSGAPGTQIKPGFFIFILFVTHSLHPGFPNI